MGIGASVGRCDADDGRRVVDYHDGVSAQTVEGVDGEAIPFGRRIEGGGRVRVTGRDGGFAAQRLVEGAGGSASPFGARIDTDLTDHVDCNTGLRQHNGVVAVEPTRRRAGLVGLGDDRRVRGCLGDYVDVSAGDGAGEGNRESGSARTVRIHLYRVAIRGQVDRRAGPVEDLDRLVEARPLDVLGEEELTRSGRGRYRRGEHRHDSGHQRDGGHDSDSAQRGDLTHGAAPSSVRVRGHWP